VATHDRSGLFHRAEALAQSLPPLLVAANRVAATVSQGVHGRRRVGQGETFWQYRSYQPGDSTHRIDWRKSAKSQRIFIRQTEWEAAQSVWLWRDASPSMHYRSADSRPLKVERAELLLLALATLLMRGGEHISLLGSGEVPAPGRASLRRIAAAIESGRATGSLPSVEPLPRYARLVVIGDLLAPLTEIRAMVSAYAARGVRGHLLQVLDPAEETLPFAGRIRFHGLEGDGEVLIGRVENIRSRYHSVMATHQQELKELTRSAGWSFAVHHLHMPPQPALLGLFLVLAEAAR
jgi:uncharacterized protein (DUF58 family)